MPATTAPIDYQRSLAGDFAPLHRRLTAALAIWCALTVVYSALASAESVLTGRFVWDRWQWISLARLGLCLAILLAVWARQSPAKLVLLGGLLLLENAALGLVLYYMLRGNMSGMADQVALVCGVSATHLHQVLVPASALLLGWRQGRSAPPLARPLRLAVGLAALSAMLLAATSLNFWMRLLSISLYQFWQSATAIFNLVSTFRTIGILLAFALLASAMLRRDYDARRRLGKVGAGVLVLTLLGECLGRYILWGGILPPDFPLELSASEKWLSVSQSLVYAGLSMLATLPLLTWPRRAET